MKPKFNFKRILVFVVALMLLNLAQGYGYITPKVQMFMIPILIVLFFAVGEYLDRNKAEDRFKDK